MKERAHKAQAQHVTDTELAVLKVLWDRGQASIRELTDRLYPGGGTSHYATVQKLLARLEGKEYVSRRQEGRINIYEPTVARDDLIAHRLQQTADRLCDGSLVPLLSTLVASEPLSREDLSQLRALVDRLDREKAP